MDCRNNNMCSKCSYNHAIDGKVKKQLSKDVEYCLRLKDGSVCFGSDKYIYFLENYCHIVGVCKLHKEE